MAYSVTLRKLVRALAIKQVSADKVYHTVAGAIFVADSDVTVLFPLVDLVFLLIENAVAVGAKQHTRELLHSSS